MDDFLILDVPPSVYTRFSKASVRVFEDVYVGMCEDVYGGMCEDELMGPPLSRTMCFTNSNRSSTHATMLLAVDGLMLGKKMLLVSTMCSMSCPVNIDVT